MASAISQLPNVYFYVWKKKVCRTRWLDLLACLWFPFPHLSGLFEH